MVKASEGSMLVDQIMQQVKVKKKVRKVLAHVHLLLLKIICTQFRSESTSECS
jgi:hypothetical protein